MQLLVRENELGAFFSGVLLLLLFFVDQTEEEEDNKRGRKRKSERTPGARNAARIGHRVVHTYPN